MTLKFIRKNGHPKYITLPNVFVSSSLSRKILGDTDLHLNPINWVRLIVLFNLNFYMALITEEFIFLWGEINSFDCITLVISFYEIYKYLLKTNNERMSHIYSKLQTTSVNYFFSTNCHLFQIFLIWHICITNAISYLHLLIWLELVISLCAYMLQI